MRKKGAYIQCVKKLDGEIDAARDRIVWLVNHTLFAEGDSGGVMAQDIKHWEKVKRRNRSEAKRLSAWIATCEELKKRIRRRRDED